jgi:hypothetical protein
MYIKSVALKIQHARCVITASGNISKERRAFIFKSQSTSLLERLEPLTELARVAFQKNRILSNSAVRTWNFELWCLSHAGPRFI